MQTSMSEATLKQAFAQPVHDSQQAFRQILKAMSEPGVLASVESPEAIGPLYASTFAICQTLLDQQTPTWLSPAFDTAEIRKNLHFHTGLALTNEPSQAAFALALPEELEDFTVFSLGNHEYPETSCSVIVQVKEISNLASSGVQKNKGNTLKLTGPGIPDERCVQVATLPDSILAYLADAHLTFPLGLDFMLVSQTQLLCLPRTTNVEVI